MSERAFASFLGESLDVMRRETPRAYAALCERLAPHVVHLVVGDEALGVCGNGDGYAVSVVAAPADASVDVRTTRATILALIDARLSLIDAILTDGIELRGCPDDVVAFHDALLTYVHGAVRSPSFPRLLRAYRAQPDPDPTAREVDARAAGTDGSPVHG